MRAGTAAGRQLGRHGSGCVFTRRDERHAEQIATSALGPECLVAVVLGGCMGRYLLVGSRSPSVSATATESEVDHGIDEC
jgi:hypothetical protein